MKAIIRSLFLAAATLLSLPGNAAPERVDNVEAELIARHLALAPGEPAVIGLRLKHDPQWHTYWINPGDSGMPTTLVWKLPPGTKAGPIQWPTPKRIPLPPMMNHGYDGEIVLPVEITLPADWPAGQKAKLAARADWLVCKDVCIPGGADLTLEMPVVAASTAPDPKWKALFDAAYAAMPQGKVAKAEASTAGGMITLKLEGVKPVAGREAYVLAGVEGLVEAAAPQTFKQDGDATVVTLAVTSNLSFTENRMSGIIVGFADKAMSFEAPLSGKLVAGKGIDDKPAGAAAPAAATPVASDLSLALALVFALIGGAILNLMPCVFPILSLKVLGFARGGSTAAMRLNGLSFAAGVVLSFLALAGALLALRAAGEAVGWGFQLQSPPVVTVLALLFFLIGLNLSGVFELTAMLPSSLASASLQHPAADAFLSGVLAAIVAAPCTAPFMGAALGYAVTQSPWTALLVFGALGVGMAVPYLLLAWFPAWLKRLPKPGPWLARFKQFLAFPMYGTVVWLAWVLSLQIGPNAIVWLGGALVLIGLGAWLLGTTTSGAWRGIAVAVVAGGVFAAWPGGDTTATPQSGKGEIWAPWSEKDIAALNAAGTPVFVDFTAAWCVTCQVNKKVVLETAPVQQAFNAKSVKLMRADWTRRDPAITAALAAFGRNGVPVYVFYAPGKPPQVLPEILSERIVTDALKSL